MSEVSLNVFLFVCIVLSINYFIYRQFVRSTPAPTVGQKLTGGTCRGSKTSRACRGGQLLDNILDWEHDLPEKDLDMAINHSRFD